MARIRVNKIEAARRQIDCGIRMLFANEEPVAIHTLAWAGLQILRDLSAGKGAGKDRKAIEAMIMPGKEKEFWTALKRPANFFKHADRDPERILESFPEEVNELVLAAACGHYDDLGYSLTPEMTALQAWLMLSHPQAIPSEFPLRAAFNDEVIMAFQSMNRADQLALGKDMLEQFIRQDKGPDKHS